MQTTKVKHIVMFKFKAEVTPAQMAAAEQAFADLPVKIPLIVDLVWGNTAHSLEGLQDGFTHCFDLTFNSFDAVREYLVHPDHEAFGQLVRPLLEKAIVLDFQCQ